MRSLAMPGPRAKNETTFSSFYVRTTKQSVTKVTDCHRRPFPSFLDIGSSYEHSTNSLFNPYGSENPIAQGQKRSSTDSAPEKWGTDDCAGAGILDPFACHRAHGERSQKNPENYLAAARSEK